MTRRVSVTGMLAMIVASSISAIGAPTRNIDILLGTIALPPAWHFSGLSTGIDSSGARIIPTTSLNTIDLEIGEMVAPVSPRNTTFAAFGTERIDGATLAWGILDRGEYDVLVATICTRGCASFRVVLEQGHKADEVLQVLRTFRRHRDVR